MINYGDRHIPQLVEDNTILWMDAPGGGLLYDSFMVNAFVADSQTDERSALRLMLLDLNIKVVGEASSWPALLEQVQTIKPDLVLVDWGLIPNESGLILDKLRAVCPIKSVIVLISQMDAREQATFSTGADVFISKGDTTERITESLRISAQNIWLKKLSQV